MSSTRAGVSGAVDDDSRLPPHPTERNDTDHTQQEGSSNSSRTANDGNTVVCHSLTEVRLERCIIYGGCDAAVYVYPRGAPQLCSCVLEGPSTESTSLEAMAHAARVRRQHRRDVFTLSLSSSSSSGATGVGGGVSALALLEARAQRRREEAAATSMSRTEYKHNTMKEYGSRGADGKGGNAGASRTASWTTMGTLRMTPLSRVTAPAQPHTAVALYCDDGDVRLHNCVLGQTRLGLVLRDACVGTRVMSCAVAGVTEVGLCCCGIAGAARVGQCELRRCGWDCVLIKGPTEAGVTEAERAFQARHAASQGDTRLDGGDVAEGDDTSEAEDEEDETTDWVTRARRRRERQSIDFFNNSSSGEGGGRRVMPVFAQHPVIRDCRVVGAVRFQGMVRDGAMCDNVVYEPRVSASIKATSVHPGASISASTTAWSNSAMSAAEMRGGGGRAGVSASALGQTRGEDEAQRSSLLINSSCGVDSVSTMRGFHVVGVDGAEVAIRSEKS